MRVAVWGEILWDRYPDGARLGGAPSNVAFHLARLGVDVALVSRVGADELGDRAVAELARAGVNVSRVQRDDHHATGVVDVAIDSGEARYTMAPDRAWQQLVCSPADARLLAQADAFCFGTLAQICAAAPGALDAALRALSPACLRVCDVNLRRSFDDVSAVTDAICAATVVKLNDVEADALQARLGVANAVAWMLADADVDLVALTRGPAGARLVRRLGEPDGGDDGDRDRDDVGQDDHPGMAATPGGDNVGAGDAFTAVLTAGLLRGWPLHRINRAANRYASAVASHRGATPTLGIALDELADEHA